MNDRLHELANQAAFETSKKIVWVYNQKAWQELYNEKFAELIVRECQDRVEHYIRDCGEIGSLPDTVIMKHFGVES